jgi:hypothetical protein
MINDMEIGNKPQLYARINELKELKSEVSE